MAWSCLYLVKLCGTHLTSAFSVSGIHCCNYAIMSLYSRVRLYTPTHPHPRSCNMPQLDFFFFFYPSLVLMCFLFSVFSMWLAGLPHLILTSFFISFGMWLVCGRVFGVTAAEQKGIVGSSFEPPQSLMCALLIHFNSCEWAPMNMFVRTLNVCVPVNQAHGNSSVCQGLCHKKYTKKTALQPPTLILLISHLHELLSCMCLYQTR